MRGIQIFIFAVLIALFCCSGEKKSWHAAISEIDGVIYIKNPEEPFYKGKILDFTEDLRIGRADGPKEYQFFDIRGIAVDEDESIYVGDFRERHIKVFDKNGRYVRTIGRPGQGPGEIGGLYYFQITTNNELMVIDRTGRKIQYFSKEGDFLKAVPLQISFISLRFDSVEYFYGITTEHGQKYQRRKLIKMDSDFKEIEVIDEIKIPAIGQPMQIFKPEIYYKLRHDGCLVYANSEDYSITIKSPDGQILRKISKAYKPVRITLADKKKLLKEATQDGMHETLNFSANHPAFWSFTLDDFNRIFVRSCEESDWSGYWDNQPEKDYTYDVFDPEGRYIGKFSANIYPIAWKKDHLYTIEEDELGFECVKRYKITWMLD